MDVLSKATLALIQRPEILAAVHRLLEAPSGTTETIGNVSLTRV